MTRTNMDALQVLHVAGLHFIYAPHGQGEELRRYLGACGYAGLLSRASGISFDRLELTGGVDAERLQGLLDEFMA